MKVWAVVHVWRGILNKIYLFKYQDQAQKKYKELKSKSNTLEEVEISHKKIITLKP